MKNMKYHPHGSILFTTLSVEEGLFLLSNPLCISIIKSCLASAQAIHSQVKVCHLIAEGTHLHLLMVVDNPDDVPGFIKCFKTESAHAFNHILGRQKRTIWCEGYDSPIVLTPIRAAIVIAYLYSNPAKDNLCSSIEEYPGFSSWKIFQSKSHKSYTKLWKRIRRYHYRALPRDSHNLRGYTKEAARLLGDSREVIPFTIHPNAWLEAYGITDPAQQEQINTRILERIRRLEVRAEEVRERGKKKVIGRQALISQRIDPTYCSNKRKGKRMWCLSEDKKIRISFIEFFRELMSKAREIQKRWKVGDYSLPYPPGLYPPCMPKLMDTLYIQ